MQHNLTTVNSQEFNDGKIVVAAGDTVTHHEFDHETVYNVLKKNYLELDIQPVEPGTALYSIVGTRSSYVKHALLKK